MQFRLISAFLIFIGSYTPLAIILAIQNIPFDWWSRSFCAPRELVALTCAINPFKNPILAIAFIILTISSAALASELFKRISFPHCIEVVSVKAVPNEIINYTFPYVVSFMGISYSEPEKLLGFLIFLLWMFAITYKSGQIIMNPLLLIFGWNLYEANIKINGVTRVVKILKKDSFPPGHYKAQTIQDFYICKE
ncbi:hypothetical protein [Pseudomonas lactucae]|uniref:Uncharacterized protein n=1 Tax=Pseudomonas lactucae TaxID=2813360 RepID=A0A9X0YB25_9PSED|nr:hypothetical protein [Pseudomonas lactucae]MBN2976200.1 hypothetical protein [Pseudomonas lactucae]MBN2986854.1 hypothetical protein [Pseudomonas lactucae]